MFDDPCLPTDATLSPADETVEPSERVACTLVYISAPDARVVATTSYNETLKVA